MNCLLTALICLGTFSLGYAISWLSAWIREGHSYGQRLPFMVGTRIVLIVLFVVLASVPAAMAYALGPLRVTTTDTP